MPELPEVETIRTDLEEKIIGLPILFVKIYLARIVKNQVNDFLSCLEKNTFSRVERRGKLLIFHLKKQEFFLLIHLKMTGQLVFVKNKDIIAGGHSDKQQISDLPNKWTRAEIVFKNNARLYFNDMRTFGYLKLVDYQELQKVKNNFGYEPFDSGFNEPEFLRLTDSRKRNIKAFLLDQKYVAGLGNIYVDEVLFRAGVSPGRSIAELSKLEKISIYSSIKPVLRKAIKYRGTTFNSYVDSDGKKGGMVERLQVFGRDGKNCYGCGSTIEKTKIAGRGTHFCPVCQK